MAWSLRIQLCGHLAVERDGVRVEARLPGKQGARLLGNLAANQNRWVSRDELVDAVWGDSAPPDAAGALAPLLSKVRRVVAPTASRGAALCGSSLPTTCSSMCTSPWTRSTARRRQ